MNARKEFEPLIFADESLVRAQNLSGGFCALLDMIEAVVPVGRERSLAITKLQEAFDWALRGIPGGDR